MRNKPKRYVIEEKDGKKKVLDTQTNVHMTNDDCPDDIAQEICDDFNGMHEFLEKQRERVRGIKRIVISN